MAQGMLPWQPILGSTLAKWAYSLSFVTLVSRNGLHYRHSDIKKFICDDLAILFIYLVNFGPVTPEFKRLVGLHPLIFFKNINLLSQIIS